MIRINLLPFRKARKKENVRQQVTIFVLAVVLLILGMYYYQTILSRKLQVLDDKIKVSQQQLADLGKLTKEIEEIKKKLELIKKKTEVIKNLEKERRTPVILLETVTSMVISDHMWFTSLSVLNDGVDITGVAMDNRTIADFMTQLEGTKQFTDVNLKKNEQLMIKTVSLKQFDIFCKKIITVETGSPVKAAVKRK